MHSEKMPGQRKQPPEIMDRDRGSISIVQQQLELVAKSHLTGYKFSVAACFVLGPVFLLWAEWQVVAGWTSLALLMQAMTLVVAKAFIKATEDRSLSPNELSEWQIKSFVTTALYNIVGSSTLTTAIGWQTAVYAARERYMGFKDGKGQPLLMPDIVDGPMVIVCSSADAHAAHQALNQERNLGTSSSVQTTNLLKDVNKNVTLWDTSRLTTGNAYMFLTGGPVPPCYVVNRTPLESSSSIGNNTGSDETAEYDTEWVQWRMRKGFGLNEPYCAIKLTA